MVGLYSAGTDRAGSGLALGYRVYPELYQLPISVS